jgi:transcriptional regulator with XRE-family HTH domain
MIKVSAKATGNKIKIMMIRRGKHTHEIAKDLGYADRSTINRWLRGETVPSYENLANLSIILNCDIKDLVAYENAK